MKCENCGNKVRYTTEVKIDKYYYDVCDDCLKGLKISGEGK